jgi:hypothetical protein
MRRLAITCAAASITTLGWTGIVPATVASADAQSHTFSDPGALDWQVPAGVTCATFDVYGANGGDGGDWFEDEVPRGLGSEPGGLGGLGGRATATIQVTPGETIVLTVGFAGDRGIDDDDDGSPGGDGGIVGGGDGGSGFGAGGGGGGGASDVRRGGSALADRVVVAGGGGGGGAGGPHGEGGDGGSGGSVGTEGGDGLSGPVEDHGQGLGGGGGTATAGGAAGGQVGINPGLTPATAGSLGVGGDGASNADGGGGGGGGWYGGGGGGAGYGTSGAAGGGGSSHGPAGATFATGVGADNDGDGTIIVRWTPGDTSCVPPAVNPNFTG